MTVRSPFAGLLCLTVLLFVTSSSAKGDGLRIRWEQNFLTISGDQLPGQEMRVQYLEAYCRPGSTDRDWAQTVIGHTTELVSASDDGKVIKLKCTLKDGVVVDHVITAGRDEVDFRLTARNPTDKNSLVHWAQPCIRVDRFVGVSPRANSEEYLGKSFIFVNGALKRMPVEPWAKKARYTPGQVWCPKGVPRSDINPRPLSNIVSSNGIIGCFSGDETMIFATAFEPYQELFQGVVVCLHADFRFGGLEPGETKHVRGKIYLVPNDVPALLKRYEKDFPEQVKK
jgi:hypothetical protein